MENKKEKERKKRRKEWRRELHRNKDGRKRYPKERSTEAQHQTSNRYATGYRASFPIREPVHSAHLRAVNTQQALVQAVTIQNMLQTTAEELVPIFTAPSRTRVQSRETVRPYEIQQH